MRFRAAFVALAAALVACSGGDGDEATALDTAALTEHLDCGYGFEGVNDERTARLVVDPLGDGASEAPAAGEVELPSPDWRVVVQFGEHFGERGYDADGACTDVIDGSAPEERVSEEWEVVEGTLAIHAPPPDDESRTAGVTADGLVALTTDGERVALDRIVVPTSCWGCFPG